MACGVRNQLRSTTCIFPYLTRFEEMKKKQKNITFLLISSSLISLKMFGTLSSNTHFNQIDDEIQMHQLWFRNQEWMWKNKLKSNYSHYSENPLDNNKKKTYARHFGNTQSQFWLPHRARCLFLNLDPCWIKSTQSTPKTAIAPSALYEALWAWN